VTERRGDDVALGEGAVGRGRLGAPYGEEADVGAQHGVDRVLGPAQVALAGRRLDVLDQLVPRLVPGDQQRRVGRRERLEQPGQGQQLTPHALEGAALLVLVFQGLLEPEQRDRRRVRIDLDRPPRSPRPGVEVETQPGRDPRPPRAVGELRLARVGRVRPGVVRAEVAVEGAFGGAVAGRVGDDQRRVDRDETGAFDVRRHLRRDVVVGPRRRHVQQPPVLVDHRDPGRLPLAPRQVEPDDMHPLARHAGHASGDRSGRRYAGVCGAPGAPQTPHYGSRGPTTPTDPTPAAP
jgi:hypothetical protein